jgi:hypothetical protein
VVFGLRHMDVLCREYLAYYHQERPHQSKGNAPLVQEASSQRGTGRGDPRESSSEGPIACRQRLGGLLKHYYRGAA